MRDKREESVPNGYDKRSEGENREREEERPRSRGGSAYSDRKAGGNGEKQEEVVNPEQTQ